MKQYIYILIILLLASCYDDKGNYDYTDVNTVESGLEEVYYRFTDETIVTIDPKLSQSLEQNKENLKFLWLHSTTGTNFYVGSSVQSKVDTVCETAIHDRFGRPGLEIRALFPAYGVRYFNRDRVPV